MLRITTRVWFVALLLGMGLVMAGCASTKVVVPSVNEGVAHDRLPGKFVWFDLFTTDLDAASNFYESLLGWDIRPVQESNGNVRTAFYKGKALANMVDRKGKSSQSQWLSYISVTDVDKTLENAKMMGGKIHKNAMELPNRGRVGIALDPQKAAFAIVASPVGDPEDSVPTPNTWLGSELWTTDVKGAEQFYAELVGYAVKLVTVHEQVQYRLLMAEGRRRGGITVLPWENVAPEWIPYIAVDDVLATVAKVRKLGGEVLLAPDMSVEHGLLAVIADPTGALFGVQQVK